MQFTETQLPGVFVIELERHEDDRGWFARTWCREEFAKHGLPLEFAQNSISHNARRGTLRGMHFQTAPHAEAKLIRCVAGAVHDVALDLRPDSPTFKQSFAMELSAENGRALFLPEGIAHGFQTLADDSALHYQMTAPYVAEASTGVHWNDPAFDLEWPVAEPILSERDQAWPDFSA